jgi:multiple sugar transport system permease protein
MSKQSSQAAIANLAISTPAQSPPPTQDARVSPRSESRSAIIAWSVLVIFLVGTLLPFYWMIVTSVKPTTELFSRDSPLGVANPTSDHYVGLFQQTLFVNWFSNSVIISGSATLISLVLGSLAAYGVARSQSRVAPTIARIVLMVYLIPRAVLFIPLYEVLNSIGLYDTLPGLLLSYLTFSLPFVVWLLIGYFQGVPRELDEAALIDGATSVGALWRVVIPVVGPALVAASIFAFSMSWNEFMYPLALIQSGTKEPFTVGIAALQQGDVFSWGQLMAAGTVAAVPILIAYSLIQRYIVSGLTAGAVKG